MENRRIVPGARLPLVSVLIRSMDRPTLARALDSVAAQTWPNLEIIVVAACGHNHRLLPDEYRGRPLRQVFPAPDRHLARPDAGNLCLESAHGEWLIFLDDDDEYCPTHLATLLGALPTFARVIYSRTLLRDRQGRERGSFGSPGTHGQLFCGVRSSVNATLIHRSLIDEGVRFDSDLKVCEDYDFQINCASRTEFHYVPADTCVWYASLGQSGCGFGANEDLALHELYRAKVQHKWKKLLDHWIFLPGNALVLGQEYLRGNNIPTALMFLEKALVISPADINALNLCGMANMHVGNFSRAEALLLRALKVLPRHPGLEKNLHLIRERMGRSNFPSEEPVALRLNTASPRRGELKIGDKQ